ncbi:uncharacterized protein LTR77_003839 [Saxophila tyrrhenica]|uniref:Uncharacterized protein n=1 Tax=Saxophila tyrrhenica TaxID=1690608 RepID=A0AAV9PI83_9PEZI|nr:hypothetical protein LTR77_003839 [Saxophila tyrrhenica]
MAQAYDSKKGAEALINPLNEPEPSAETGLGTHFGSTMAPANASNSAANASPTSSKNPFRSSTNSSPPSGSKSGAKSSVRSASNDPRSRERFPDYRADAFSEYSLPSSSNRRRAGSHGQTPPSYQDATSSLGGTRPRRGSSLKERYPGDKSHQPLDIIRRDSRKAHRSPHLHKKSMPGADSIDKLDPAVGGIAYHHEGPYDAALMSRNRNPKTAPLGAVENTNQEALKATPRENIKDAVERHKPLDGTAVVPPGEQDRFGRVYQYREGADLMHEGSSGDAGYKRWPGKDYDPEDLKGQSEPGFSLGRAMQAHKIDDQGIEMEDRAGIDDSYHAAKRNDTLDDRDPVLIAGDDSKYVDAEIANSNDADVGNSRHKREGSKTENLKRRIGSLRHKGKSHEE